MSRLTRLRRHYSATAIALALGIGLGALATTGCNDASSATELVVEGPPMIRQIIMTERLVTATGTSRNVSALAFGEHADFDVNDDGAVNNGSVSSSFTIRVIMDELLIGNYLEEIACRDGTYQTVPEGTTPDHIAGCSVQADVLPQTCTGPNAVCLDDSGPIGVLDDNEDGTSDDTRMIDGAVRIVCADGDIDVPMSQSGSFWQPSGNQQVPALGGFTGVGPAIILATSAGLPTDSDCTIEFDSSVVDKEHIRVCAPERGLPENGCEPGDVSRVVWHTEPIRFVGSNPPNAQTGVALVTPGAAGDARILVQFNTPMSATIGAEAFTLLEGGVERPDITAVRDPMTTTNITITVPGGYLAGTEYMLIIETGLTDAFGVPIPETETTTVTWSTVAAAQ